MTTRPLISRDALRAAQATTSSTEEAVNEACCMVLAATGVEVGSTIRIKRGRHAGEHYVVRGINATEAEVAVRGTGRWFSAWFDEFDVVDASQRVATGLVAGPSANRGDGCGSDGPQSPAAASAHQGRRSQAHELAAPRAGEGAA